MSSVTVRWIFLARSPPATSAATTAIGITNSSNPAIAGKNSAARYDAPSTATISGQLLKAIAFIGCGVRTSSRTRRLAGLSC